MVGLYSKHEEELLRHKSEKRLLGDNVIELIERDLWELATLGDRSLSI